MNAQTQTTRLTLHRIWHPSDFSPASEVAMVTTYGMSDEVGLLTYDQSASPFLPGVASAPPQAYSAHTAQTIDAEVRAIVAQAHAQVRQLLGEKRATLDHLAQRRLQQEVLEGAELQALLTSELVIPAALSCGS